MQIHKHACAHTRWCLVWIKTSWSAFVRECQAPVGLRIWDGSSLFSGMPLLDVCLCCCQWCVNLIISILVPKDIGGLIIWSPPNSWERQRNQGSLISLPAEKLPSLSPAWTTTYLPHLACRVALPANVLTGTYPTRAAMPSCMGCTVRDAGKRVCSQETSSRSGLFSTL